MLHDLQRYLASCQLVDIIYLDRNGHTSKRTLRLHSVDEQSVKAYCLTRRAYRVFKIENILAVYPAAAEKRGA